MKFLRTERGYMFSNGLVQIGYHWYAKEYWIQMVLPKKVVLWTIYRGKKKPFIRNLWVISLLLPSLLSIVAFMGLVMLFGLFFGLVAKCFYFSAQAVISIVDDIDFFKRVHF